MGGDVLNVCEVLPFRGYESNDYFLRSFGNVLMPSIDTRMSARPTYKHNVILLNNCGKSRLTSSLTPLAR